MVTVSPRPILLKPSPQSPGTPGSPGSPGSPALTAPAEAKQSPAKSSPKASGPATGKLSISRNYVIPPRPKPGRKPSTEVPPSRRKAQNREAQRAFRERKSQVVRALEEQLAQQARDFEKQQQHMRDQIALLQNPSIKVEPPERRPSQISPRSSPPSQAPPPVAQPGQPVPMAMPMAMPGSPIQLFGYGQSPRASAAFAPSPGMYLATSPQTPQTPPPASPGSPFAPVTPADVVGLELLDHVLEQKLPTNSTQGNQPRERRPSRSWRSPETPKSPGVVRTDPPAGKSALDLVNTMWSQPAVPLRRRSLSLETDFTLSFAPASPRAPKPFVLSMPTGSDTPAAKDRCGFCTDNTPCVCAETAARERNSDYAPDLSTLGSPLGKLAALELPSGGSPLRHAEGRRAEPPTEEPRKQETSGCTGNPSNCTQCQQDPMLTLFCSAISSRPPERQMSGVATFIPAQAAYKTLSRHPGFARADLGDIVDALSVRSSQIEVNSVAKVLRMLDTRT